MNYNLTIVSHEAKKKQAVHNKRLSYLQVDSTAVKFVNALNKPPLKILLSYQGLGTFELYRISNPTMEEIDATNPKYQPLQV